MTVQTKNFATLVSDAAAAVQGRSAALIDFTDGSILRAVIEAAASQGLWLESQALQILAITRAATSVGPDLDSFVADYGLERIPAVGAVYQETFTTFTPASTAFIALGTQVQTADGTQTYAVVADMTNSYYDGSTGYNRPSATASIAIPVEAIGGGSGSNVSAGAISVLLSAISGVDTVNNASGTPTTAGVDAETDAALRVRFRLFLSSLASATKGAIEAAIDGVQAGLTYLVSPNVNPDGSTNRGYLTIVVDDGSGDPSGRLLTAVTNAVARVVAEGITFGVFGPTVVTINVTMTATVLSGYSHTDVANEIVAAVTALTNSGGFGDSFIYNRLYQTAYNASPGINEITALLVNGGTADISLTASELARIGTVVVS